MSDPERIRRPTPARTKPIRSWDGLLGVVPPNESGPAREAKPERVEDVLARSVELGYRVVDEYLARGQEAAQRLRRGAYGAEEIAQDAQSVASQLVRSASDFAGAWVEFFALAGRDAAPAPVSAPGRADTGEPLTSTPAPETGRADEPSVVPLRVRLCVTAERPVETALEIAGRPTCHGLTVHSLRLATNGTIRLDDVRVEAGSDGVFVIRVTVPSDQPPGRYIGLVVDDSTNLPVGELTIIVAPLG